MTDAQPGGSSFAPPTFAPADDAPHLLIVDDDRRIRSLLSRYLLSEGYRVTTAESAADARARLAGLDFDLLILDVMMPGESGFDLVKSIRRSSTVPVLILTARDAAESRITGLELGADDYVVKPYEPRVVVTADCQHSQAHPAGAAASAGRDVAVRPVHLPRGARRAAPR